MIEVPENLFTIREVAQRLRVDDTTVRRWIKNGVLDAVILPHLGKRTGYRIKERVLQRVIDPAK